MSNYGILLVIFLGFLPLSASAAEPVPAIAPASTAPMATEKIEFEGVDITALVNYIAKQVTPLTKPVTIYNWSNGSGSQYWSVERPATSEGQEFHLRKMTQSFWASYGSNITSSMYGSGLYAGNDPFVSHTFGGTDNWILLEMNLPVGFRLLDLVELAKINYPRLSVKSGAGDQARLAEQALVDTIAAKFNCPKTRGPEYSSKFLANDLVEVGGTGIPPECQRLARKVLRDILHIDGFAYPYSQSSYSSCDNTNLGFVGQRAYVITSSDWVQPSNYRFFTKMTTHSLEDRIRIMTVLLLETGGWNNPANTAVAWTITARTAIANSMTQNPNHVVSGSTTTCQRSTCTLVIKMCDITVPASCYSIDLQDIPRRSGPGLTKAEAEKRNIGHVFWPDLEGKSKLDTVSTWLKENNFGCSGVLPYQTAQTAPSAAPVTSAGP